MNLNGKWILETNENHHCKTDSNLFFFSISRGLKKEQTVKEIATDGLSILKYTEIATILHPIFTHIMVDLATQPK